MFRYAVQTGRAERDVTADLRSALAPVVSEHHATITEPRRIGELLRAIDGYNGQAVTAYALKLSPLVFVRPGELRHAALASTCLNEQGYHPDLIELQLAHAERNQVRAAYNKAQRLPEQRKMMEAWSDYLDGLRAGASVVPLRRAG